MSRAPFDDPFYREMMHRGFDPRELLYRMDDLNKRIARLEEQISAQPNVLAFVQVNYPEIIEQYELVQTTKKKIGAKTI